MQFVGPMSKVHLVVGQNNSGKSNVLKAAQEYLPQLKADRIRPPSGFDRPVGNHVSSQFALAVAFHFTNKFLKERLGDRSTDAALIEITELLSVPAFHPAPGGPWFLVDDQEKSSNSFPVAMEQMNRVVKEWLQHASNHPNGWSHKLGKMLNALNIHGQQGGPEWDIMQVISKLYSFIEIPRIATISAFRRINEDSSKLDAEDFSGKGLVKRLARLESPGPLGHQEDLARFEAINTFARMVLEDPTARLRVPATQDMILVESGRRVLELDRLGTGVHEVIILAVAATLLEDHLVCIEEPEVHLHPILQRRLVRYLKEETSNRYLIATHSAQILDSNIASVSHVRIGDGGSTIQPATAPEELSRLAQELGYKASDIIQANAVIWVEGPSDRIYMRHWIKLRSGGDLVEGIHYSIMFYGGRLLSHLSSEDVRLDDFIALRRLNRNLVIVIDSDRKSAHTPINKTKKRIRDSFADSEVDGFAWVTKGREIENYIPKHLLDDAIRAVHKTRVPTADGLPYSDSLSVDPPLSGSADKVAIAEKVVASWRPSTNGELDLEKQISAVIRYIRRVNAS